MQRLMHHEDFIYTQEPEPHVRRMRNILSKHPEVKNLFGSHSLMAYFTLIIVALQLIIGAILQHQSLWLIVPLSYLIGATANHALFVVIHECSHNLVFRKASWNKWLGMISNLPQVFPSSIQFAKYHLLHHVYQGDYSLDADLPSYAESKWVRNSPFRKTVVLLFFSIVQGILRPSRLKKVRFLDTWFLVNILIQCAFLLIYFHFTGWFSILYLTLSTFFSVGLHPLGGRWIQEHYVMKEGQETYSYYGPLNKLCFNVGFHNEHHDFTRIPWIRLPELRKIAPEFYDSLYYHKSWTRLLHRFIFDPNLSFFSRTVRPPKKSDASNSEETGIELPLDHFQATSQ